MQGNSVAFRVFEMGNEAVLTDANTRHQRLSAVTADRFECHIDCIDVDVNERSIVQRCVAIAFDERAC